jgi:hypothetical protein
MRHPDQPESRRVTQPSVPSLAAGLAALTAAAELALAGVAPAAAASRSRSPSRLLAQVDKAVQKAGSMTFSDRSTSGKVVETYSGAASGSAAAESLTSTGAAPLQVVLSGGTIYLRSGSTVLESALGLSATAATAEAGKWIALQTGDAPYESLAGQLTVASELNAYIPASHLRIGKVVTVAKQRVIPVYGYPSASAANGATAGSAALFLSTKSPYLPVAGSLVLAKAGADERKEVAVFTHWGKPFTVTVPTGAVPYASLAG